MHRLLLLLTAISFSAAPVLAQSFTLCYVSDPGDYVGQGQSACYDENDGTFTMTRNDHNGLSFSFMHATQGSVWWYVDLAAADDEELSVGTHPDAQRFPFQEAGHPGMSWAGSGRGCSTITGSFTVSAMTFDFYGVPRRALTNLEQHCEGAPPALHGTLDFDFGGLGPANLVPHNVLVTWNNLIHEYEFDGTLVGRYPVLGSLPGGARQTNQSEVLRDLAMGPDRTVFAFNGTQDPYLSTWEPEAGSWSHVTEPDWAIGNYVTHGGIATAEDFVFVSDTQTGSNGILRHDRRDGSWLRFGLGTSYCDLAVGWDGRLYALDINHVDVDVYEPVTLAPAGSIVLGSPVNGVAVAADGRLYGASWSSGLIIRFTREGVVEASVATGLGYLTDIDLDRDGRIVFGSWIEGWGTTTTELGPVTGIPPPANAIDPTFVAFAVRGWASNQIFLDGFEAGDTGAWSATAP